MTLKILRKNGKKEEYKGIYRLSIIGNKNQFLYFETPNDEHGKGASISMSDIKGWEAVSHIPGGSFNLNL